MYGDRRYSYEVRSRVPRVKTVRQRVSPLAVFLIAVFVVAAFVGSGFLGAHLAYAKYRADVPESTTTIIYRNDSDRGTGISSSTGLLTAEEVVLRTKQSVVEITTESVSYGRNTEYVNSGAGSGVLVTENGHVLTAYHVVEDAESIKVRLYDGTTYNAEWVKGDKLTDTAVVKINVNSLNCASVGNSNALDAGQDVIAIGNPLGSLGGTVTKGSIAALNRTVKIDGQTLENLIQLSAPLNPGDSGGGIFNMYGALVGIVNAKSIDDYGYNIAFASPINQCMEIAEDLMTQGFVEGRVDTEVFDVKEINNSATMAAGLYFMGVNRAGVSTNLIKNDYIVSVAGVAVSTIDEWQQVLNSKRVGEQVEIVYRRGGIEGTVKMQLLNRMDCD